MQRSYGEFSGCGELGYEEKWNNLAFGNTLKGM